MFGVHSDLVDHSYCKQSFIHSSIHATLHNTTNSTPSFTATTPILTLLP